ncbi:hypothetical protein [Noviherbaspirillum saxi]|uniref:hypothetical protein n=1 Tax=Noviherbaspirillum saxi TaxID=2320863 RepID=UPI001314EEBD|nr:hypothetical protein [Noviherbaspirillum saxi]
MSSRPLSPLNRANAVLRDLLMRQPGLKRREIVAYVAKVADCHRTTVERAMTHAAEDGFLNAHSRVGFQVYHWNDSPDETVDHEPQVITRIPASQAPRFIGKACKDGIEFFLHYGCGSFA